MSSALVKACILSEIHFIKIYMITYYLILMVNKNK